MTAAATSGAAAGARSIGRANLILIVSLLKPPQACVVMEQWYQAAIWEIAWSLFDSTRRDLPIPGSPTMNTIWPCPALAFSKQSQGGGHLALAPHEGRQAPFGLDLEPAPCLSGRDHLPRYHV